MLRSCQIHLLIHIKDSISLQYLLSSQISFHILYCRFHFSLFYDSCCIDHRFHSVALSITDSISFATSVTDFISVSVLRLWRFHFTYHFMPQISFHCISYFYHRFHFSVFHDSCCLITVFIQWLFLQFQVPAHIFLQLRLLTQITSKVSF